MSRSRLPADDASEPDPEPSGMTPARGAADVLLRALAFERKALKEVLRENRSLRAMTEEVARSLQEISGSDAARREGPGGGEWRPAVLEALRQIREMQRASAENEKRYTLLKAENSDLLSRCQDLMKENDNLFKLYVASQHLHSSLYLGEVVGIVSEIVLNIIGAGDHVIFLHDERARVLVPVLVKGLEGRSLDRVPVGEGPVGRVVAGAENYATCDPPEGGGISLERPLVVIGLKTPDRLIGAIVIYRLLAHKSAFTEVDYTLFDFFAAHAATAIHSAKLYGESEKKVSQMKEFLKVIGTTKAPGTLG